MNRPTVPAPKFTREGWERVLERWEDAKPKQRYDEMLAQERKVRESLKRQGIDVEEIEIDAAKMLSWLARQKRRNDGLGRAAYLAEAARCRQLRLPAPE
jgi:hypothetical protein